MGRPALRMAFADAESLGREVEQNLRHGRAFVHGAGGVEVLSDCDVVLVHPETGTELSLAAQAVMVSDSGALVGVGIELRPFGPEEQALLERFAAGEPVEASDQGSAPVAPEATRDSDASEAITQDVAVVPPDADPDAITQVDAGLDEDGLDEDGLDGDGLDGDGLDEDGLDDEDDGPSRDVQRQKSPHERLRGLSPVEQQKRARGGELNERVILERLYGKGVWEALLHNPRLTPPEVARIARKGTVPRPLLELILDNNAWIQVVTVRRALLGNPRVTGEGINKLLRITPKHELKTIAKTTAYSSMVREAARKMLDR